MKKCFSIFTFVMLTISASAMEKVQISVSLAPLAYIVSGVGGDAVEVNTLLPDGKNPHDYEISPSRLMKLGKSRLFFAAGQPFEKRAIKTVENRVAIVDLADRFADLESACTLDHFGEHHHHHHHAEDNIDPHIWFAPLMAAKITGEVAIELQKLFPADPNIQKQFEANAKNLITKFELCHQELAEILKPYAGRTIYVYHPAFGYFAREFGMKQQPIELEGREVGIKALNQIIAQAREEKVKLIFVQPQFNENSARTLAAGINGKVVSVDPVEYDLVANFERLGKLISESFAK